MDYLTYPAPIDPASIGQLVGPDQHGGIYELVETEVLPDGRGRGRFRPMPRSELDARWPELDALLTRVQTPA